MTNVTISRKHLFAVFLGFLVIVGIGILTSTASFFVTYNVMRNTSVSDFRNAFTQQPILAVNWLLRIISFISPILGGFVVGLMVRQRGWLYGGLLGVVLTLLSVSIVSLTFFLPTSLIYGQHFPPNYGYDLAQKNILNQLLHSPITIVLTSLGGLLGERFYNKRQRKKG